MQLRLHEDICRTFLSRNFSTWQLFGSTSNTGRHDMKIHPNTQHTHIYTFLDGISLTYLPCSGKQNLFEISGKETNCKLYFLEFMVMNIGLKLLALSIYPSPPQYGPSIQSLNRNSVSAKTSLITLNLLSCNWPDSFLSNNIAYAQQQRQQWPKPRSGRSTPMNTLLSTGHKNSRTCQHADYQTSFGPNSAARS